MWFSLLTLGSIGMLPPAQSRNILSGFVRPHPRFLIQSITSEKTPEHFDEFMKREIDQEEFCQAPGDLFPKHADSEDGLQSHKLYQDQVKCAEKGVANTREFVKEFEALTRGDTLRSASEMEHVWKETIIKELSVMMEAVTAKQTLYMSRLQHIRKIAGNSDGDAEDNGVLELKAQRDPKAEPITHVQDKKLFTLHHDPSNDTFDSHSDESWKAMYKAYHEAKEKLKELLLSLDSIQKTSKEVLEEHVKEVREGGISRSDGTRRCRR